MSLEELHMKELEEQKELIEECMELRMEERRAHGGVVNGGAGRAPAV